MGTGLFTFFPAVISQDAEAFALKSSGFSRRDADSEKDAALTFMALYQEAFFDPAFAKPPYPDMSRAEILSEYLPFAGKHNLNGGEKPKNHNGKIEEEDRRVENAACPRAFRLPPAAVFGPVFDTAIAETSAGTVSAGTVSAGTAPEGRPAGFGAVSEKAVIASRPSPPDAEKPGEPEQSRFDPGNLPGRNFKLRPLIKAETNESAFPNEIRDFGGSHKTFRNAASQNHRETPQAAKNIEGLKAAPQTSSPASIKDKFLSRLDGPEAENGAKGLIEQVYFAIKERSFEQSPPANQNAPVKQGEHTGKTTIISPSYVKPRDFQSSFSLKLKPEGLGELNIEMKYEADALEVVIKANRHRTKEIMEQNIGLLQNVLNAGRQDKGLQNILIFIGNETGGGFGFSPEKQFDKDNKDRTNPALQKIKGESPPMNTAKSSSFWPRSTGKLDYLV